MEHLETTPLILHESRSVINVKRQLEKKRLKEDLSQ